MDKIETMKSLIERLNKASEAYYNGRGETMTDYEWDALFDELKGLETETGTTLPGSPTAKVSADNVSGRRETHEYPTLSLAKTKKPEDLVKWSEGKSVWLSWKLDGLTLVATFDQGRLAKVVTRGNGHEGTNITHLSKAIGGIPQSIPYKGHAVVRGEAVIAYADFEKFNIESDEAYANPRNLASGSLTLKDVEEVKARKIQWIPFTLVHIDDELVSWGARMDWLKANGMKPVEHECIEHPDLKAMSKAIDRWTDKVVNSVNPYPVDGLVVSYDDTDFAQTGSITGHHATRGGLAFKWQDEAADTPLEYVEWSCAASTISPVAVFKPVELEGTTVKRASLCNISECERLGIAGQGTMLSVIKANKIIPKVIQVIRPEGQFEIPQNCPVCGASTEVIVSPQSGTKTLHCSNKDCPAKQLKRFARFVSKAGMDIDGISEQTLSKFINLGWVGEFADIYHLNSHALELSMMEGFGRKSVSNMLSSIEKSRNVEAHKLLFALTIPMCGVDVCTRLLSQYGLNELIDKAKEADDLGLFSTIEGIGIEKSSSFIAWFKEPKNQASVANLLKELNVRQAQDKPKGARCQGLTFVVTGDVHHFKNRDELKSYIANQGGKVTGSVSKSTSFLINNDVNSTSAKNQKAHALGIPILSEEDFLRTFGGE